MSKKELLEKETKLKELESAVLSNFGISNGSLFTAAEPLLVIKEGKFFKAPKCNGKMAYRTFKAYLDHFELDAAHRKLLEKLITFHEFLIDTQFEDIVPQLPTDDKFWTEFMKVKPEFWPDAVKTFKRYKNKVTVDAIATFLSKKPQAKVGYSATRKVPTPIQHILGSAKKLDENAMNELILRAGEDGNATFDRVFRLFAQVKEALGECAVVCVDNALIEEDNRFAVTRIDGISKAVRFVRNKISRGSIILTAASIMVAGYGIGRAIEYGITKLM